MKNDLLESLLSAKELVQSSGELPEYIWSPGYGWIIFEGEPTEAGARFYEEKIKPNEKI